MILRLGFVAAILACALVSVSCSDRYVDPLLGSNLNVGTLAFPFLSISSALPTVGNGDVLHLQPGTHNVSSSISLSAFSFSIVGEESGSVPVIQCYTPDFPLFVNVQSAGGLTVKSVIIQGCKRAFEWTPLADVPLTLDNVSITAGGSSSTSGSGVLLIPQAHTTLSVANCTFDGLLGYGGSAIYASAGTVVVNSSTFRNNHAYAHGGSILLLSPAGGRLQNVTFENNEADDAGADISAMGDLSLTVESCTFKNSSALRAGSIHISNVRSQAVKFSQCHWLYGLARTTDGGCVYCYNCTILLENNEFQSCTSGSSGGAFAVLAGSNATVTDSRFYDNFAAGDAGSIQVVYSSAHVQRCVFSGGRTAYQGGAIAASHSVLNVSDSAFSNNSASQNGGHIFVQGANPAYASVFRSTFSGGTAQFRGGSMYIAVAHMYVADSTMAGGWAVQEAGAAYLTSSSAVSFVHVSFVNNSAGGDGGAIKVVSGSRLNITDCQFNSNAAASAHGGAVCCVLASSDFVAIVNSSFFGNVAQKAGALWLQGSPFLLLGSQFINNTATTEKAGAVMITGDAGVEDFISDCRFYGNRDLTSVAGAIGTENHNAGIRISRSVFEFNYAYSGGGAINFDNGKFVIEDSLFNADYTMGSGGSLFAVGTVVGSAIRRTQFIGSRARDSGGCIYRWQGSVMTVDHVTFYGCVAETNHGGAVAVAASTDWPVISNTTFDNCAAPNGEGGAIWSDASANGDIVVVQSRFLRNTAGRGGAVRSSTRVMKLNDVHFLNNSAVSYEGGAVYLGSITPDTQSDVYNVTFQDNRATHGGALYYSVTSGGVTSGLNILHSWFVGNKATTGLGGAVSMEWASVNLTSCRVIENEASTGSGGGFNVYEPPQSCFVTDSLIANNVVPVNFGPGLRFMAGSVVGTRAVILNNTVFSGNVGANSVGALDVTNMQIHANYCIFSNNVARDFGGAIGSSGGPIVKIDNSEFVGNTVSYNGGAVAVDGSADVFFTNTRFLNNSAGMTASYHGGALLLMGGALRMSSFVDCHFVANSAFNGGAVYAHGRNVVIVRSVFRSNVVPNDAGCIYIAGDNADKKLLVSDSLFDSNVAVSGQGGAILTLAGLVEIVNSTFSANTAVFGGAISFSHDNGVPSYTKNVVVSNCNFTSNVVVGGSGRAGAIGFQSLQTGAVAEINNTVFISNVAALHSGAVYFPSSNLLRLVRCMFEKNVASGDSGGAVMIDWTASTFFIDECHFRNNRALGNHAGGLAVYASTGVLNVIQNSTFVGCQAVNDGGAVWVFSGLTHFYNCSFINNTAANGAAIRVVDDVGGAKVIDRCSFSGGVAGVYGGALHVTSSGTNGIAVSSSSFVRNLAQTGAGGAVTFDVVKFIIRDSWFADNVAQASHGGSVFSQLSPAGSSIVGCTFTRNFAFASGGSVLIWKGSQVALLNNTFLNSTAVGNDGGGCVSIWADATPIPLLSSNIFSGCSAPNGLGGCLFVSSAASGQLLISDSSFSECTSTAGGAIAADSREYVISNTRFVDNVASQASGGVIWSVGSPANSFLRLINVSISRGSALGSGAMGGGVFSVCYLGCTLYMEDCDVRHNSAIKGGAIYTDGATVVLTRVLAASNFAVTSGPVIHIDNPVGDALFSNLTLRDNYTPGEGTVCIVGSGVQSLQISNSTFQNNYVNAGGALKASSVRLLMNYCVVSSNVAVVRGGGVDIASPAAGTAFEFLHVFNNSVMNGHGGGMHIDGGAVDIVHSFFSDNLVKGANVGGAVRFATSGPRIISSSHFRGNKAGGGAAIYVDADPIGGPAVIHNCTFVENESLVGSGGAVILTYMSSVGAVVNDSSFVRNKAYSYGGALSTAATILTVSRTVFDGNVVTGGTKGGALALIGTVSQSPSVQDSTFINNTAPYGGAIYIEAMRAFINSSTFSNNVASSGGAISFQSASGVIDSSMFYGGYAFTQGGHVAVDSESTLGQPLIVNSSFSMGRSATGGGSLWFHETDVKLINISVYGSTCLAGSGSAILVDSGSIDCDGCSFFNVSTGSFAGIDITRSSPPRNFSSRLVHCWFDTPCSANFTSGAMFRIRDGASATIKMSTFDAMGPSSSCTTIPDSIVTADGQGTSLIFESIIVRNQLTSRAFAVGVNGSQLQLRQFTAEDNHAVGSTGCGVVSAEGAMTSLQISDSVFRNNSGIVSSAVCVNQSSLELTSSSILKCHASVNGAVYVSSSSSVVVKNNTFSGNNAALSGGGLAFLMSMASVADCRFFENSAGVSGSAVFVSSSSVRFEGCLVRRNSAVVGGAFAFANSGGGNQSVITDSQFVSNSGSNGGAVSADQSSLIIRSTVFDANRARNSTGGALHAVRGDVTVTSSLFFNNSALSAGGAVSFLEVSSGLVENVTMASCSTQDSYYGGGSLFVAQSKASLIGLKIQDSHSSGSGGAFHFRASAVEIKDLDLVRSFSSGIGGGFFVTGCNVTVVHSASYLTSSAIDGGAFYVERSFLTMTDVLISNISTSSRGSVFVSQSTLALNNVSIAQCQSYRGTGITSLASSVNIANSSFAYLHASDNGGAVFAENSRISIADSDFRSIRSDGGLGGGLYVQNTVVNVSMSRFQNIESAGGALVACVNCSATLSRIAVSNVSATVAGGVLYAENGWISLAGSTVQSCVSPQGGFGMTLSSVLLLSDMNDITCETSQGPVFDLRPGSTVMVQNVSFKQQTALLPVFGLLSSKLQLRNVTVIGGLTSRFVVLNDSSLTGDGLALSGCSATVDGACLLVDAGSSLVLKDSSLSNCSSVNCGSAVHVRRSSASLINVAFSELNGGAVSVSNSNVTLHMAAFDRCNTAKNGSNLAVYDGVDAPGSTVNVVRCSLRGHPDAKFASAIYVGGNNQTALSVTQSEIWDNYGLVDGYALRLAYACVSMDRVSVKDNLANATTASISVSSPSCICRITGCSVATTVTPVLAVSGPSPIPVTVFNNSLMVRRVSNLVYAPDAPIVTGILSAESGLNRLRAEDVNMSLVCPPSFAANSSCDCLDTGSIPAIRCFPRYGGSVNASLASRSPTTFLVTVAGVSNITSCRCFGRRVSTSPAFLLGGSCSAPNSSAVICDLGYGIPSASYDLFAEITGFSQVFFAPAVPVSCSSLLQNLAVNVTTSQFPLVARLDATNADCLVPNCTCAFRNTSMAVSVAGSCNVSGQFITCQSQNYISSSNTWIVSASVGSTTFETVPFYLPDVTPSVRTWQFSHELDVLVVVFTMSVNSSMPGCSMLSAQSQASLGNPSNCTWTNSSAMTIALGLYPNITQSPMMLSWVPNSVVSSEFGLSVPAGPYYVAVPSFSNAPAFTVSGQTLLEVCHPLYLTVSVSSGDYGRPVTTRWTVFSVANNSVVAGPVVGTNLSLPRELVPSGKYYVETCVANFPAVRACVNTSVEVDRRYVKSVDVVGSTFMVLASRSSPLLIASNVTFAACSNPANRDPTYNQVAAYIWRAESDVLNGSVVFSTQPNLLLPGATLRGGVNYTFTLTVTPAGMAGFVGPSIRVFVASQPVRAIVDQGTYMQLSAQRPLLLSAVSSVDPDDSPQLFTFAWLCASFTNVSAAVALNMSYAIDYCPGIPGLNVSSSSSLLSIPAGNLTYPKAYVFVLTAAKGSRTARAAVSVVTLFGSAPLVSIVAPERAIPALRTRLTAVVDPSSAVVTWFLQSSSDSTLNMTKPNVVLSSLTSKTLVLGEGVLIPGAWYRFGVRATSAEGTSEAYATIIVNSGPRNGSCSSNPSNGLALVTLFSFECSQWQDEDTPLAYSYYVVNGPVLTTASRVALQLNYPSASLSSILLPAGMGPNNTLIVEVDVADAYGAVTTSKMTITVTPQTFASALAQTEFVASLVSTKLDQLLASKDSSAALQLTTSISQTLRASFLAENSTTKLKELADLTSSVSSSSTGASSNCPACVHGSCVRNGSVAFCHCLTGFVGTLCATNKTELLARQNVVDKLLDGVVQVGAAGGSMLTTLDVLATVTANPTDISDAGASKVTAVLSSVANSASFTTLASDASAFAKISSVLASYTLVVGVGESAGARLSNLAQGRNRSALKEEQDSATLRDMLGKLALAAANGLVANEKPLSTVTSVFAVTVQKLDISASFSATNSTTVTTISDSEAGTSFVLPSAFSPCGSFSSTPGVKLVVWKRNPFAYSSSSANSSFLAQPTTMDFFSSNATCSVSNLSVPITFSLKAVESLPSANASRTVVCAYFNEGTNQWSTSGVRTNANLTAGSVSCETTHLTSFVTIEQAKDSAPQIRTVDVTRTDAYNASLLDLEFTWILVGILCGGMLLMLIGFVIDWKQRRHHSANIMPAAGIAEGPAVKKSKYQRFAERVPKKLRQEHLAIGYIFSSPNDELTRPQRALLFTILVTSTLAVNAMFAANQDTDNFVTLIIVILLCGFLGSLATEALALMFRKIEADHQVRKSRAAKQCELTEVHEASKSLHAELGTNASDNATASLPDQDTVTSETSDFGHEITSSFMPSQVSVPSSLSGPMAMPRKSVFYTDCADEQHDYEMPSPQLLVLPPLSAGGASPMSTRDSMRSPLYLLPPISDRRYSASDDAKPELASSQQVSGADAQDDNKISRCIDISEPVTDADLDRTKTGSRLDKLWRAQQQQLLLRGENGETVYGPPSVSSALFLTFTIFAFGGLLLYFVIQGGGEWLELTIIASVIVLAWIVALYFCVWRKRPVVSLSLVAERLKMEAEAAVLAARLENDATRWLIPRWTLWVAYVVSFLVLAATCHLALLYALEYEAADDRLLWVFATMVGIAQDFAIVEPVLITLSVVNEVFVSIMSDQLFGVLFGLCL